ncbi:hypothetical protein GON26_12450 [Flavobacterium sp. GA093]|uniref:Uncharacterized protein n=1 Tax=Flavobacterium hydrocarbonoxydans TaxID=2683249 RepID=A0A6I4NM74_9FLAO|nr:hypothetical protein [Flavobacterium hydrocarbonoxydans]MWB95173.1 hypothetical protein [Flavobacterium hydrocarbonoxydans]
MVNEEKDKRKIAVGRDLIEPHAEGINKTLEQRKDVFNDQKEKAKNNQVKLTIEELRSCKGFETVSEAEGQEIIDSLFQLAVIVYNF